MRQVILLLASTTAVVFLFAYGMVPEPDSAQAQVRPNIVLILTDDMREDDLRFMPNTRALLVDKGATFKNAFVTFPLCCPSRATILTGRYPHNHGVMSHVPPAGGFLGFHSSGQEKQTIAKKLKASGYRTALFGKYMNGYCDPGSCKVGKEYVPPGWSEWHAWVGGATMNDNGRLSTVAKSAVEDDVVRQRVGEILSRWGGDQPIFLHVSAKAPHANVNVAERHRDLYAGLKAPRSPAFNEADVSDKPAYVRNQGRFTDRKISYIDRLQRYRARTLRAADDLVGSIVEKLRKKGELDSTYIFFTSDNGYQMGEHRLYERKLTPYKGSIGVPMVVRGPDVPRGTKRDQFVLNNDLAPTFADLASVPLGADGRSLVPLLRGSAKRWRESFLIESTEFRALRTQTHVYVKYKSDEREIYDLSADPHQLDNSYSTADPALKASLAKRLDALRDCRGAGCARAENGAAN